MTAKPFPSQAVDPLDSFDLDDEFMDLHVADVAASDAMGRMNEPFDPAGLLRDDVEAENAAVVREPLIATAVAAPPPAATMPALEGATALTTALATGGGAGVEVSIPRIGVHIFAERQDTADAADRAGQDRRMSRATTQIRLGGVQAAIEAYQAEPTPPLIIVESLKAPQDLLAEIDQLAEVCDSGTKVVIIGATNDILLFRELMRRGVSEYLVAPVQPLQLIAAIGGLFSDPSQPFVGRTIAFVGARGGAGACREAGTSSRCLSR